MENTSIISISPLKSRDEVSPVKSRRNAKTKTTLHLPISHNFYAHRPQITHQSVIQTHSSKSLIDILNNMKNTLSSVPAEIEPVSSLSNKKLTKEGYILREKNIPEGQLVNQNSENFYPSNNNFLNNFLNNYLISLLNST